jgi:quercetin dioxygenase-like cupin family protein
LVQNLPVTSKPQTGREHQVGTLTGPLLTLDLNREIEQLRSEGRWQSGHTAKTLAKYSDFRMVLIVMKTGGRLEKHRTEGRISVHTLDGRIRFSTAERSVELAAGQILTLEHDIPHDVEGIVDSAFLLTIAWPDTSSVR